MVEHLYKIYFCLLALLNVTLLLGAVILYKKQHQFKSIETYFFSVFSIGIISIITLFSIVTTQGKTINVLSLFLFFVYYFIYNKKVISINATEPLFHYKKIIEVNIIATVFFIIYATIFFYNRNFFIGLPNRDLNFYSRLSSHIIHYQTESNFFTFTINRNPAPYHYFDIWINGIVSLFNKSSVVNYILITTPFLLTGCYIGVKNLLYKNLNTNSIVFFLITLCLLLLSGVYINGVYSDTFLMGASNVFSKNAICYQKLLPIYLLLLWVIFFLKENKYELLYISLTIISIYYISSIIAILGLFSCIVFHSLITRNKIELRRLSIPFIVTLMVILFYHIFSDKTALRMNQVMDFTGLLSFQKIKTSFNIIIKTNLQISVLYFYLGLIFVVNFKNNINFIIHHKKQISLLVGLYILALVSWCAFNHVYDSVQFFSNLIIPTINICAVLFILRNYTIAKSYMKKIIILTVTAIALYFSLMITLLEFKPNINFDEEALSLFKTKYYPQIREKRIANLKPPRLFNTFIDQAGEFSILAPQLLIIDDFEYYPISMGGERNFKNAQIKFNGCAIVESSIFYNYCRNNKIESNISTLQLQFIKEKKIQVIVTTSDYLLPKEIYNIVTDSIKDNISKEKIYLLSI